MKAIVLFDGRDASGKGATIRRAVRYMNEKRNIEHFFHAGEIVLFDRSWYNRTMFEPIMGFCSDKESKRFIKDVPLFEQMRVKDGIRLLKFYFSVSKKEQLRRFKSRHGDLLKQYKISVLDDGRQPHEAQVAPGMRVIQPPWPCVKRRP
jgi:polyphosphate kinase 2 (PPK2 family)